MNGTLDIRLFYAYPNPKNGNPAWRGPGAWTQCRFPSYD